MNRQKRKNSKKLAKKKSDSEDTPTEVLSQAEIDQLLTAINAGDDEIDDTPKEQKRIKIYDFARPDIFSKDNLRALNMIHELFARLMTSGLSSKLKEIAHIHVASVDQLTTEEFIRSIPTPTSLGIINMDPLPGNSVIEFDPAVSFTIIDLLLGGDGEISNYHELTNVEMRLIENIMIYSTSCMREAFTNILDLRPRVGQLETNPQFCYVSAPAEMGVLVTLEVKICDTEGMINIYYPRELFKDIIDKLSYSSFYPKNKREIAETAVNTNNIKVPLIAELGRKDISLFEISNIRPNDEFYFDKDDMLLRSKNDIRIANFSFEKDKKIKVYNIRMEKMKENKVNLDYETGDINKIKVQTIAELGRKELYLSDIKELSEGTIIQLDAIAGEPVNLFANNVLIAKGEVVVMDDQFAVRVIETL